MVTEIPSMDEIFGRTDDSFNPDKPDVDEDMDNDEQLMYLALFLIFAKLYSDFEHKSIDYVAAKFPNAVTKAGTKLVKTSKTELTKIIEERRVEVLTEFKIHEKVIPKVKLDYDMKPTFSTMNLSIKGAINQLKDDVAAKASAFKAGMGVKDDFNLKANFKRATRRTKNFVKYNAQFAKQKVTRSAQKMRYGSKMLYFWVVSFRNTCNWCFALARLPPKPIEEWPYDHPNGRCDLVPSSNDSSDEYLRYLEMSNNITIL